MPGSEPAILLAVSRGATPLFEQTYTGPTLFAGRAPDCHISLNDQYVSSRHFRLDWDGSQYRFKDLGSSNGSWINGVRTLEAVLKEGDKISIGATHLAVQQIIAGEASPEATDEKSKTGPPAVSEAASQTDSGVLFRKVLTHIQSNIKALWTQHDVLADRLAKVTARADREALESAREAIHASLRSIEGEMRNLEKDQRRMKALHAAAAMINRVTDLRGRLNAILDLAIGIMEADCGFLLLYDEKNKKINVALNRGMAIFGDSTDEMETMLAQSPTPSMSIAREVLRTRRPIIVADLHRGSQFDEARSIMQQEVFAVLCAPMLFDNQLIGLIYVDFRNMEKITERRIGPGDQELFEVLAGLAATAIQNAKFFRSMRLETERRTNLQRYLSPELVDQVIRQGRALNLAATRRQATVLFCDIRGFTPIAESTEPTQLIRQLNDYFTVMLQAITAESGSLDKFLGDGLMAFFGPLLDLENSEIAAVRAACAMQRSMVEINRSWAAKGWRGFEIGVGLNAGEVVAGNLGSSDRLEYTVIGDTVNVASRLSGVAKPGQILITKGIAERLPPGQFDVRPLEAMPLKGKSEKVAVFEIGY